MGLSPALRMAQALAPSLLLALALGLCAAPGVDARPAKRHRAAPAVPGPAYGSRADVRQFAAEVAARRHLPVEWVAMQLGQARRIDAVRKLVMPPPAGTAKNWAAYRARFVEPQRIQAGVAFWRDNEAWLDEAERRWGVPPQIVVAIVGVETFYGRITGGFRAVDALSTLAFDFPPGRSDRSAFFRGELEELLVLCAREGVDPGTLKGSYAGAIGLAQFMPGSINRVAVDFDGDGHVDLQGSAADVVGSVAHFLAVAGWQRGLATHFAVTAPADPVERATLLAPDIRPTFSAAQFAAHGATLDPAAADAGPLALVELQNGDAAPSDFAGTQNFYVLTRYNWSSYYAMAVIELGEALAEARDTGALTRP